MRILVLGSTGMLGHKMVERLRKDFSSVIGVSRPAFDVSDPGMVIKFFKPDVVINCVGVIKQREQDSTLLHAVNAKLPHILQSLSPYLIHFSTDCVFSGNRGQYTELDMPDPVDPYGQSKYAGEPYGNNTVTFRTSIVGRERANYKGLLEWFLHQTGTVQGYESAIFSGVTTNWLADTVKDLLKRDLRLTGLYHIASQPVNKFQLLKMFQKTYDKKDVEVVPTWVEKCDRSLNSDQFQTATGIKSPDIEEILYWQKKMDDEESNYV